MAYEIDKRTEADDRWFRFETPSEGCSTELNHTREIVDGVLRFRVFKVDPRARARPARGAPAPRPGPRRPPRRARAAPPSRGSRVAAGPREERGGPGESHESPRDAVEEGADERAAPSRATP